MLSKIYVVFLGRRKGPNYEKIVRTIFQFLKALGCNVSLKLHFLHSRVSVFPYNKGAVMDEHTEKFNQDVVEMENRYIGK